MESEKVFLDARMAGGVILAGWIRFIFIKTKLLAYFCPAIFGKFSIWEFTKSIYMNIYSVVILLNSLNFLKTAPNSPKTF